MTEKRDEDLLHADVWLQKYPGLWENKVTLARDPDELMAGSNLHDEFAKQAVRELYLKDDTCFRITRNRLSMVDYVVRGGTAWTIAPLREGR